MQRQPSRGVLRKWCSENMQQIYRRTLRPKCDLCEVCKICCIFSEHFFQRTPMEGCFWIISLYFKNSCKKAYILYSFIGIILFVKVDQHKICQTTICNVSLFDDIKVFLYVNLPKNLPFWICLIFGKWSRGTGWHSLVLQSGSSLELSSSKNFHDYLTLRLYKKYLFGPWTKAFVHNNAIELFIP